MADAKQNGRNPPLLTALVVLSSSHHESTVQILAQYRSSEGCCAEKGVVQKKTAVTIHITWANAVLAPWQSVYGCEV